MQPSLNIKKMKMNERSGVVHSTFMKGFLNEHDEIKNRLQMALQLKSFLSCYRRLQGRLALIANYATLFKY